MPTSMLRSQACLGDVAVGHGKQIGGGDLHVVAASCRIWLGSGMCLSKTSLATGTRPGWATQVPSWPARTSRSLSWRTFSSACLIGCRIVLDRDLRRHAAHGVDAAPVAGLDQQVHVGAAGSGWSMVTWARSGRTKSGRLRNFLMKLKM